MKPITKLSASAAARRLDQLPGGQRAIVSEVIMPDGDLHRLMAMGVCRGRRVEVVQHGNPLIISVLGARIGLSARLANHIIVQPCAASPEVTAPAVLARETVLA
jgi:Fe2+ transport system protein FeoA